MELNMTLNPYIKQISLQIKFGKSVHGHINVKFDEKLR